MEDDLLYHYTTHSGLLGILDSPAGMKGSATLWATDAQYLNDREELSYVCNFVVEALLADHDPEKKEVFQRVAEALDRDHNALHEPIMSTYVTSFTSRGDLLSQWRGYSGASGYSIGFRREAVSHTARMVELGDSHSAPILTSDPMKEVKYGDAAARAVAAQAVEILRSAPLNMDPNRHWWSGVGHTYYELLSLMVTVKNDAFKEEHEWRLITTLTGDDVSSFREGPLGITPYLPTYAKPTDGRSPIAKVIVGPGPEMRLRVHAAKRVLERRGHRGVEVVPSRVPFRG